MDPDQLIAALNGRRRIRILRRIWGDRVERFVDAVLSVRARDPHTFHRFPEAAEAAIERKLYRRDWPIALVAIFCEFVLPAIYEWLEEQDDFAASIFTPAESDEEK